jgi:hypothetical protein
VRVLGGLGAGVGPLLGGSERERRRKRIYVVLVMEREDSWSWERWVRSIPRTTPV